MKQLLLIFFCIALFAGETKAQNGFTTYTANVNLTGLINRQTAFLVDNAGNKWIGYKPAGTNPNAGLVMYNASTTTWKLFNYTSTPALTSNNVTALAEDNSGNIWVGTDSALYKYDGSSFTRYTFADGLPSSYINCLESFGGNLYIGTYGGMSIFDGTNFTTVSATTGHLPYDYISAIAIENAGLLWIGSGDHLVKFTINGSLSNTSYVDSLVPGTSVVVKKIHIDAQNYKWLSLSENSSMKRNVLLFGANGFKRIKQIYDYVGPDSYGFDIGGFDFVKGPHNGVVFNTKLWMGGGPNATYFLVELVNSGKAYYYKCPFGNAGYFLESHNNKLYINGTISAPATGTTQTLMFREFDVNNYVQPFGLTTTDNNKYLDINNVKAGMLNRSDMHWDMASSGNASYEVPKGSGRNSNFASGLWIGGLDASQNLHMGAQTYRQSGCDFWPGPLRTTDATTDSTTAIAYDKIWKVNYTEINDFITNYNNGTLQGGSYTIPENIMTWPGSGNISQNYSGILAPFVDVDNDAFYNPLAGDYPKIKGDQALYFIYNDKLSTHQSTGALPLGVEVHVMAYAYGCPDVLNGKPELDLTTFYNYKIINRSTTNYHDVYTTLWSDVDLGYYADDYIGCNVADNYGYVYNGDTDDESAAGIGGYGVYPPAQGFAIMKGPLANTLDGIDNDNDGIVDEPNEECGLNKFTYFNNNFAGTPAQTTDPDDADDYYGFMKGQWKDGTPFTCGGNGYAGTTPSNWVFTGDPSNGGVSTDPNNICGNNWTELSAGNIPNDRRLMMSCGPFNLQPGEVKELEYAFVTSFDSSQAGSNTLSVAKLKTDIQKVKAFYALQNKPNCNLSMNVGIEEESKEDDFMIYPNPANDHINVRKAVIDGKVELTYELVDVLGKAVLSGENNSGEFSINIKHLDSGVYFLRLSVDDNVVVKKIIKE